MYCNIHSAHCGPSRVVIGEMQRQVGDLVVENGLTKRGVVVRHHPVLPRDIAGSKRILAFIATELSTNAWINVMTQYRPAYRAHECPELARPITSGEYEKVVDCARRLGLHLGIPLEYKS